jgi:hypothetical protein
MGHLQESNQTGGRPARGNACVAVGIFFLVLAAYVSTGPGRIDIIDGQARYDVTYHWLVEGRPIMRDPWIKPLMAVKGVGGLSYSYYGPAASVFAMPLVWFGLLVDVPPGEPGRFLFSLTSAIFGALVAVILYLFYVQLGFRRRTAIGWTMVSAFTTLIWPASASTFDNAQHAFFAIAATYLGFLGARRQSKLWATGGGLAAGVLVLYQEYFLMIIPALAISTLDWGYEGSRDVRPGRPKSNQSSWDRLGCSLGNWASHLSEWIGAACRGPGTARESCQRYACFLGAAVVGPVLSLAYNDMRFGSLLHDGKLRFMSQRAYPLLGNPLAGFLTILLSPGKGIFFYSPPLLLALWGLRRLFQRSPELGVAIVAPGMMIVLFISGIAFAGGDWCWGPRYLVVLLPLLALGCPFVCMKGRFRRALVVTIIGLGLMVQVLALSVENQRFFFARGLDDFFWAEDSWFYFRHSALVARAREFVSLKDGPPPEAKAFNPPPNPEWCTYAILGPPRPRSQAPQWMRQFKVFYLPRPWPIWIWRVEPDLRPINVSAWIAGLFAIALMGATLAHKGLHGT